MPNYQQLSRRVTSLFTGQYLVQRIRKLIAAAFLVFVCCFIVLRGLAQPSPANRNIEEDYLHRSWGRESGLPDNEVNAIVQTRDGYLWVATPLGLARFDGSRFIRFDPSERNGRDRTRYYALAEDQNGTVWVRTDDGLLAYSPAAGLRWFREGRNDAVFQPLARRAVGGLWTILNSPYPEIQSVSGSGMITRHSIALSCCSHPEISSLVELPSGGFWVGDGHAGHWLNSEFAHLSEIRFPNETGQLAHTTLFLDDDTGYDLVNGYVNGKFSAHLYRLSRSGAQLCVTNVIENMGRPMFLMRDRFGALWMPGGKTNLFRYADGLMTRFRVPGGFDDDYVRCLSEDRDGNLWYGGSHSGLHCLQPRRVRALTLSQGLAGFGAECFAETPDGKIWIGTENGLTRFDGQSCTNFDEANGLARRIIRALTVDRDGLLWVGTLRGLHTYDGGKFTVHPLAPGEAESKIRVVISARQGGVWVGTVRGLYRIYQGRTTRWTLSDGLSTNEISSLLEDRSGALWAGTPGGGVNRLTWPNRERNDGASLAISILSTTNGLSSNFVRALHEDGDGAIWIATDNGLNRYHDGRVTVFTIAQGLPENEVSELLEDDAGQFWMGGDRHIYCVPRRDLDRIAGGRANSFEVIPFTHQDGFPSLEASGKYSHPAMLQSRDGRVWIGTSAGAAILKSGDPPSRTNAPVVVIEQIRANGRVAFDNSPLAWSDRMSARNGSPSATAGGSRHEWPRTDLSSVLHFSPGDARVLEIEFAVPSSLHPERVQFRYRLEGWDKEWISADIARKAYYANLPPGDYRFQVVATGEGGVSSATLAGVWFHLMPVVYQTRWFQGLVVATLAAAGYAGISSRLRKTRRIAALERQIALDNQRKRIARDIHDELGASLTQIAQLSEDAQQWSEGPPDRHEQTRRIAALAGEAVANIGEIVWANNPRYDTLEDLVAYLREFSAKYLASASVQYRLLFPDQIPPRSVSGPFRRYVLAMLKEALHNIIKHSGAKAAELALGFDNNHLVLTIHDNGVGLQSGAKRRFGNGLGNLRERAIELGGSFRVESNPLQGTTLEMRLPLPRS